MSNNPAHATASAKWTKAVKNLNASEVRDTVFKSPQRRSPPRAVPSDKVELSEEEMVGVIKHIKKMDDNMQQFLKSHMEELESLDPEKVQRIKKKIIDDRR